MTHQDRPALTADVAPVARPTAARPTGRSRTTAALAAGLVLLAVTGCGTSPGSSARPSEPAAPTTSPSTSPTEPSTEELAKVITGDVTDLVWASAPVPTTWKKLPTGEGEQQWRVGEKCVVTLQQPAGLSTTDPTQDQVVEDGISYLEDALQVGVTQSEITREQFPVLSNLEGTSMTAAVSVIDFTGPQGTQGQVYAHRAGQFGLILLTACADSTYAAVHTSDLQPFIDGLAIQTTY